MDITVRRAEPGDYEGFQRIFEDESAYSGTLQLPMPTREHWRKRLAEPVEGHYIFVACSGEEIVGNAGLHATGPSPRRAHALMLGIAVPSAWQGRGVGKTLVGTMVAFADRWLPVTRLELTVFTDNERAIALYRQFGFEVEGTHRAFALRDGRYADVLSMARLKPKPL
jgi:L-phenylalanine/L-methionine N-acetyltransferase